MKALVEEGVLKNPPAVLLLDDGVGEYVVIDGAPHAGVPIVGIVIRAGAGDRRMLAGRLGERRRADARAEVNVLDGGV